MYQLNSDYSFASKLKEVNEQLQADLFVAENKVQKLESQLKILYSKKFRNSEVKPMEPSEAVLELSNQLKTHKDLYDSIMIYIEQLKEKSQQKDIDLEVVE